MNLEVPRQLPVAHLSHSSISTYLGCPERWRRRYLELEYEPPNLKQTIGKVVGRTVTTTYIDKMASGELNRELMRDSFSTEWDGAAQEDVDWEGETPGFAKDSAFESLDEYAMTLMQQTTPSAVEEGFEIKLPHADWGTIGYIDVVETQGLIDVKTSAKTKTQLDLDRDTQATMYVAAKHLQAPDQEIPAYRWHAIKRPSPKGRSPAIAQELLTTRSRLQIDSMLEKIALVAREIEWRVETGNWQGAAPNYWLCGEKTCGFYSTCRFGGLK
jgi:PD-(D/E)XK nuclease superfamily